MDHQHQWGGLCSPACGAFVCCVSHLNVLEIWFPFYCDALFITAVWRRRSDRHAHSLATAAPTFHLCLYHFFLRRRLGCEVSQLVQDAARKLPTDAVTSLTHLSKHLLFRSVCQSSSVTSPRGWAPIQIYINHSAAVMVHEGTIYLIKIRLIHLF